MDVNNILLAVYLILWAALFGALGVGHMLEYLGGIFAIFIVTPLVAFLVKKYTLFSKIIWSSVLISTGLIFINLGNVFLLRIKSELSTIVLIYVFIFLVSPIVLGFLLSMYNFVDFGKLSIDNDTEDLSEFRQFSAIFTGVIILPVLTTIFPVVLISIPSNIRHIGLYSFLTCSATIALLMIALTFYIKRKESNIISTSIRAEASGGAFLNKTSLLFIISLILISIILEITYRNSWLLFSLSSIVWLFYIIYLGRMFRIVYH